MTYRPDIDGLRALAVTGVVLFHCGLGFPGGYTGVDVFFVISGFLINSIIWRQLQKRTFSFRDFWVRRIRRIFPAMLCMATTVSIAGYFLLLPGQLRNLGGSIVGTSLFGANIFFWRTSGYFSSASDEMPMLHCWSLAVEEQFYLFIPFLLWGLFRFFKNKQREAILVSILSLGVASFVLSVILTPKMISASFYLLPTRAWELATGAVLAFVPNFRIREKRWFAELCCLLGLGSILGSMLCYDNETLFPGLSAAPPVLGTALLIWVNGRANSKTEPTWIARLLSIKPIIFVGLLSYSWYLWHWPLLAIARASSVVELSLKLRLGIFFSSLILAFFSWKYVENMFRKKCSPNQEKLIVKSVLGTQFLILLLGAAFWFSQGMPQRVGQAVLAAESAKNARKYRINLNTTDVNANRLPLVGKEGGKRKLLVWGDSHAMSILPAVDEFLLEKQWEGRVATHMSTPPVLNWYNKSQYGLNADAPAFNEAVVNYIKREAVDYVLLHGRWVAYVEKDETFKKAMSETLKTLTQTDAKIIFLGGVPEHDINIPKGVALDLWHGSEYRHLLSTPHNTKPADGLGPSLSVAKELGIQIVDPKTMFLSSDGLRYDVSKNKTVLYHDSHHLSTAGARLMIKPILEESVSW